MSIAQKIMKVTISSQEEREEKYLDDLKSIFTKMEAQLQIREEGMVKNFGP